MTQSRTGSQLRVLGGSESQLEPPGLMQAQLPPGLGGAPALMELGPDCKLPLLVCDFRGHLTNATPEEYADNYRGIAAFLSMDGTDRLGVEIQSSAVKLCVALGKFLP